MSAPAPTKNTAASGGYEVGRPQGRCGLCNQAIEPEQKLMAALLDTPTGFQRLDCCLACWPKHDHKDVLAFWQTAMPRPEQKKKMFVDDTVLCELFDRLGSAEDPAKLNFRFVLGLILMRKRLIIYDNTRIDGDREIWSVRLKGREESLDLLNPKLGEEQVKEVSTQLGEILQQEM